jgi:isoleucyl-tRNA synthetase
MLETRPKEWLISRQRDWGTPLALIKYNNDFIIDDNRVLNSIIVYISKYGTDAWYDEPIETFLKDTPYKPEKCEKILDVMDVWFDSGCVYTFGKDYSSDKVNLNNTVIEGSDQTRGWFQSLLLVSALLGDDVPFTKCIMHGFVNDRDGKKLSKSSGNGVEVSKLMDEYGPDVLRWFVAASDFQDDIKFSIETLNIHKESYRKLRNCVKFMTSYKPSIAYNDSDFCLVSKNYIQYSSEINSKIYNCFKTYNHAHSVALINEYCSDISKNYFEYAKDILYCNDEKDSLRNGVIYTLDYLLNPIRLFSEKIVPYLMMDLENNKIGKIIIDNKVFPTEEEKNIFCKMLSCKTELNKFIESLKKDNKIKSMLELVSLGEDDLMWARFMGVSSYSNTLDIASNVGYDKCNRCWKYYGILSSDKICERCS